jgi:hypothetical protein
MPTKSGPSIGELKKRADNGKLPGQFSAPKIVADPIHQRKGLTEKLIKLCAKTFPVKGTLTCMDCTRIGKNFGSLARTLRFRPGAGNEEIAKVVVQHHFDDHKCCDK